MCENVLIVLIKKIKKEAADLLSSSIYLDIILT
jgi:hypothetical protein